MDDLGYQKGRIVVLFHITYLPLALSRALVSDIDNQRRVLHLVAEADRLLEAGCRRDRRKGNQEFKSSVVFKGKLLDPASQ